MAKPKLVVGQSVRVKTTLVGHNHYDHLYFAPEMEEFMGQIFKIAKIDDSGLYHFGNPISFWAFNDAMVDLVVIEQKKIEVD